MEIRARYLLIGLFLLAAIAGGFGFIYWLNTTGGLAERTAYRIRFDGPTAGLLRGAAVLFNGLRVGEVTDLALYPAEPQIVLATIAVDARAPIRADTVVGLDFRGLTGVPTVALTGGTPESPPPPVGPDGLPALSASAGSSQDVMTAARIAVQHLDDILAENSEPLKNTIANLSTFSDALARNSERIDQIADGLASMFSEKSKGPPGDFGLEPPEKIATSKPPPEAALLVVDPTGVILFDTQRIIVVGKDGAQPQFDTVRWRDNLPMLIQQSVVRAFENAGYLKASRPADGLTANFQLALDIREFSIIADPTPTAKVEIAARILDESGAIVGTRVFGASEAVATLDGQPAVAALDTAFDRVLTDLVGWTFEVIPAPSSPAPDEPAPTNGQEPQP